MTCSDAVSLLPWLLNGTLPAEEEAALRAHLPECPDCRRELEATREAWQLLDAHPLAAEVVAHALGTAASSPQAAAHLERCAACRAEVALVHEERDEAAAGEPEISASPPALAVFPDAVARRAESAGGARRLLAVAAAVLAVFAGAGWLVTWQRLQTTDAGAAARQTTLERRIGELEAALRRASSRAPVVAPTPTAPPLQGERLAALEREVVGLREPQGLAVIELLAEEMAVRGGEAQRRVVARDRPATLLLVADGIAAGDRYQIRVGGRPPLWEGTTRADSAGGVALHVPAGALPAGSHRVRISTVAGETLGTYRIDVR